MSLCIKKLKRRPQVFLRLTGVCVEDFEKIVKKCSPVWKKRVVTPKKLSGRPYGLKDLETHVLCLLLYYRVYTSQLFLGFLFGVDDSCISRSIKRLEPLLAKVMAIKKDRTLSQEDLEEMIIDCTEQPVRRPKKGQKKYYSGKKKRHTIKCEIRIRSDGKITHVSKPAPGKRHDFTIYKDQKPPPRGCHLYADSGYQGLDKRRPDVEIPFKKPKEGELDAEQKEYNRGLSSFRVRVENKICEMKVFQILTQTYRNFRKRYALKINIIAGIVNLKNQF